MQPDISEFSFGFALTNELINHYPIQLVGAPRFPTQNEEGKKGGYDVEIPRRGAPLFLQFKRTEKMVRARAAHSGRVGVPHYRMHLRPKRHSAQHELLLDLEGQGHEVYYAAPRFHSSEELNEYFLTQTIADNTAFILPSWAGPLPDNDDHYIAISSDGNQQHFCSREGRPIHTMRTRELLERRVLPAADVRAHRLDAEFFIELGDQMLGTYVRQSPHRRDREEARVAETRRLRRSEDYAREVAQMLYGCELLVVEAH